MIRYFRLLKISRSFSDKLPTKLDEHINAEQEAIKEIKKEDQETERDVFKEFFPDPNLKSQRKHLPQYKSAFGQSDEEEIEPFFIEDLSNFQYIYSPKESLIFDEDDYALIYKAKKKPFFLPLKLRYCWKLVFPVLFSIGITAQSFSHSTLGILLSWAFPFLMYSKALVVRSIKISKDGKVLKITYKRFRFFREKEVTVGLDSFEEPSGNSFIIWSLYEFPDDLKTFVETENVKRITFAKYWGWWSFFLIPKDAEVINREVLVNAFNGIYIDTQSAGGEEIKSRYSILYPKKSASNNKET